MKKKIYTGIVLFFLLAGLPAAAACTTTGGSGVTQQQITAERGDLTIAVSGDGKIETSREARLNFGSAGKVSKITVEEGDSVKAGDVLASLETRSLELSLKQAQMALTQAQGTLMQAQLGQSSAENILDNLKNSGDSLKLALVNAQITYETAKISLNAGIAAVDFTAKDAELNAARTWYNYVQDQLKQNPPNVDAWLLALDTAKDRLDAAQAAYDNALAGYDSNQVNLKKKQMEAAELSVALAQKNINDLGKNISLQEQQVESAKQTVKQAQQALELAEQSVAEAQKQLNEATITAPFDGVVAAVPVKEGDLIPSPSMSPLTVIRMVNQNYLELVISVDEIDAPSVKLGQTAAVKVDALPEKMFEGKVAAIYPVPSEQGGIVLYGVKISLSIPAGSGVMIGMSASADIISQQHKNVIIVPSRAITQNSQGQTIVKVKVNNKIEEKVVTVGLDDGLQAEITGGLNEGDSVVVEIKTRSSSSSLF